MRAGLLIAGALIVLIGFILTVTIIGAILGVPLIIAGIVIFILGLFLSSNKHSQNIIIHQNVGDTHTSDKSTKK